MDVLPVGMLYCIQVQKLHFKNHNYLSITQKLMAKGHCRLAYR